MKLRRRFVSIGLTLIMFFLTFQIVDVDCYAATEYTQVEWIYIDGTKAQNDGYQKFDTGVKVKDVNDSYAWELVASDFKKSTSSNSSLVGVYDGNERSGYFFGNNDSTLKFYFALGKSHDTNYTVELPSNEKCTLKGAFKISSSEYSYSVNGVGHSVTTGWPTAGGTSSGDTASTNILPSGTIKVISAAYDGEYMSLKFYGLKIWKDGTLVSNLIPALTADGKAGIYDLIKGEFIGSGDYEHGNIVNKNSPTPAGHVHSFAWQTISAPTKDCDGLEGEVCTVCGAIGITQSVSAYAYAINEYATSIVNASQPGQTVVFEFGEWNSFPKSFMADLAAKSAQGVTFEFHYKWNHESQTIIIPAGVPIDLNEEWYGPAKMRELYLQYSLVQ